MKKRKEIQDLYHAPAGQREVLQGNIAFAMGAARGGFHAADGYPGTPSTEVIDKGLAHLPDGVMRVGWSVSEAVALAVAFGHSIAGSDTLCTMKIPGLRQAGDVFSSIAWYTEERGALVIYVASDYHPSSTQHVMDARPEILSCGVPILEPGSHREMLEAGLTAAEISRRFHTPVVVLASGPLCHSEGLVALNPVAAVDRQVPPADLERYFNNFFNLPHIARRHYDEVITQRLPALTEYGESADRNRISWQDRGLGIIAAGVNRLYVKELEAVTGIRPSLLEIDFYPLPPRKLAEFAAGIVGPVYLFEDGSDVIQAECERLGIRVRGKERFDPRTEWTPASIAITLGTASKQRPAGLQPVGRPPGLCPGCPYRVFAQVVRKLKNRKKLDAVFGDIGCNTLLHFLRAMDTVVCMGASDAVRQGAVLSRPELAARSISVLGESTECHSGKDATRNAVFRQVPGVKVVLNNLCTAMTGAQPDPASPRNLDGQPTRFNLVESLRGEGCRVVPVPAYDLKGVTEALGEALAVAAEGEYTVLVLEGACLQVVPASRKRPRFRVDPEICVRCMACQVCPGTTGVKGELPRFTHLCTGCGGAVPSFCAQVCPQGAIRPIPTDDDAPAAAEWPEVPPFRLPERPQELPDAVRLVIRGVGGQGNLFLGKILARLALGVGYDDPETRNIIKGETHGMAQLGGPVVSTFAMGRVRSPEFLPGTADALIALEAGEVLRPGFLESLKEGGTILLNTERRLPAGLKPEQYPELESILRELEGFRVVKFDGLQICREIGDEAGQLVNVAALGLLSTVPPFSGFPVEFWWQALLDGSPTADSRKANFSAFQAGRGLGEK